MTIPVINEVQLTYIGKLLESRQVIDESSVEKLKDAYPGLRFTLCSEDDLGVRDAYQSFSGFDLHLVASKAGSCSQLTFDLSQCTGVLIALHEE